MQRARPARGKQCRAGAAPRVRNQTESSGGLARCLEFRLFLGLCPYHAAAYKTLCASVFPKLHEPKPQSNSRNICYRTYPHAMCICMSISHAWTAATPNTVPPAKVCWVWKASLLEVQVSYTACCGNTILGGAPMAFYLPTVCWCLL